MANADGDSSKDTIQRAQPKIGGRIVAFGFDDEVLPETFYVEIQSDAGERKKYLANESMQVSFEQNRFDVGDAIEIKLGSDGRIADVLAMKVAEMSNEAQLGNGEPVTAIDAIRRVPRNKRADQAATNSATNSATKTSDTPVVASPPATLLNGRFVRDEVGIYRRIGEEREALADEGDKIRFIDKQMDAFQAAIELAKAKDWEAIEVTGSEKFRAEAWFHAKSAGLEVIGYEATAQDQQRLAKAAEQLATKLAVSAPPPGTAAQTSDADRLAKEVLASRQQAQDFALGKGYGIQTVNTAAGRYNGRLLHETEHHLLQDIGQKTVAVHEKRAFASEQSFDLTSKKSLAIRYDDSKAVLKVPEKTRQRSR